ncbi:MAG: hypothetical protein IPI50_12025 [Saprospiraceae bacterium]|nr:hypothetical protein [Saprospiraceae bacterium]
MKQYFSLILFCLLFTSLKSQDLDSVEYIKKYNERILLSRIDDVYIPKDTKEAMEELKRLTDVEGRKKLITAPEDTIASKLHYSLGRWISLNWGFDQGSRLSHYYKLKGVVEIDDKIDLLIRAFYRDLKGLPIQEDKLIKGYIAKRKLEHQERMKKFKSLHQEKRVKK